MEFQIAESMCDISHYLPIAQVADQAGFGSFALGDSVLYPESAVGTYPYTADGKRDFLEGAPFLDPFQLFAAMSVVTQRIKFSVGVLKLPIRNPVLVAKQVASLQVFTNERFILGVGLSPWVEDFQACGEDWASRGPRLDEQIQIIRGLMTGEYFSWKSDYYDIPRVKLCPTPKTCPPIIIGGHTMPAYRRAARHGDGVNFVSLSEDELVERLGIVARLRKEYGREKEPFQVFAGMAAHGIDDMRRLEDRGVTTLGVGYRNPYQPDRWTLQAKLDWVKRFGDEVIAKY